MLYHSGGFQDAAFRKRAQISLFKDNEHAGLRQTYFDVKGL